MIDEQARYVTGDEEVDAALRLEPHERVRDGRPGDVDTDIMGILLGYELVLNSRNGWVDIITTQQARAEVKELIAREVEKALTEHERNEARSREAAGE